MILRDYFNGSIVYVDGGNKYILFETDIPGKKMPTILRTRLRGTAGGRATRQKSIKGASEEAAVLELS
jgi:hypothetical protein